MKAARAHVAAADGAGVTGVSIREATVGRLAVLHVARPAFWPTIIENVPIGTSAAEATEPDATGAAPA